MRVVEVQGLIALCEGAPGREHIDTALLGAVEPGEHLLTHLGVAIRRLDAEEAAAIGNALEAVRLAAAGEPFAHLIADLVDREPELPPHLRAQMQETKA